MTARYLQQASQTIDRSVSRVTREYRHRRDVITRTEIRQESDAEIRQALRMAGIGKDGRS